MRWLLFLCFLLPVGLFGQTAAADSVVQDTTIYSFADEAPRFPSRCEELDTTASAKSTCSQRMLINFVNERIVYPPQARENNVSGTVVIGFLVEKNGIISRAKVMKDPGAGLGMSALRAVADMSQKVRFRPAVKDGKPVRFNYVLPVRFKLEEPKPYVLTGRDTVYVKTTRQLAFVGPDSTLGNFISKRLEYPASGRDSCLIGQMDIQLLVRPDGSVTVQDILDYNDLGPDFTFAATSAVTGSFGQWRPAEYDGRPVTAAYDVSLTFAPENAACAERVATYNRAVEHANAGQVMLQDTLRTEEGFAELDKAVGLFPNDGRFRILRGQLRMDYNNLLGACEDLSVAKRIALIDWYDGILPLLCREPEEE